MVQPGLEEHGEHHKSTSETGRSGSFRAGGFTSLCSIRRWYLLQILSSSLLLLTLFTLFRLSVFFSCLLQSLTGEGRLGGHSDITLTGERLCLWGFLFFFLTGEGLERWEAFPLSLTGERLGLWGGEPFLVGLSFSLTGEGLGRAGAGVGLGSLLGSSTGSTVPATG